MILPLQHFIQRHKFVPWKDDSNGGGPACQYCHAPRSGHAVERHNVALYVRCDTQSEVNSRVPVALELSDLFAYIGVRSVPVERLLFDTGMKGGPPRFLSFEVDHKEDSRLDHIRVRGEGEPLNPDHVRSIRDQCEAAGVAFEFGGWGGWVPISQHVMPDDVDMENYQQVRVKGEKFYKVGSTASGRELDGVVHDNWPEWTSGGRWSGDVE